MILSLFFGMIPEVLFLTLFIVFTKNIKKKRIKLFLILAINYVLLIMLCRFQLLFYLFYILTTCITVKILYLKETNICDFFAISLAFAYLTLLSFLCFKFINNYMIAFYINRILLFAIFIFKNKFKKICDFYKLNWENRKTKLKVLTLRNISCIFINLFIVLLNILTIYILSLNIT